MNKTYYLDRKTGRVTSPVEGELAIRQLVWTTLETDRFRHLIYDADYGSELRQLITDNLTREYLRTEIPRDIRESLLVDDRIAAVTGFDIEFTVDAVVVRFIVESADGLEIPIEWEV